MELSKKAAKPVTTILDSVLISVCVTPWDIISCVCSDGKKDIFDEKLGHLKQSVATKTGIFKPKHDLSTQIKKILWLNLTKA